MVVRVKGAHTFGFVCVFICISVKFIKTIEYSCCYSSVENLFTFNQYVYFYSLQKKQNIVLFRGQKRKLRDASEDDEDKDGDLASQSSKESNEDGSSSEADEMAAALEAELNDFM